VRVSVVLFLAALVACHHGAQSDEAVRQGVVDYLAKAGLNVQGMDVTVTSVEHHGADADAAVTVSPKGAGAAQSMSFKYHLRQQDDRWVVVGRAESGPPHGEMAAPARPNPHGGSPGAGTPPGAARMPNPEALPPSSPKK